MSAARLSPARLSPGETESGETAAGEPDEDGRGTSTGVVGRDLDQELDNDLIADQGLDEDL